MSSIDFQNGFICGLATVGLTNNIYTSLVDPYLIMKQTIDTYTLISNFHALSDTIADPEFGVYIEPVLPYAGPADCTDTTIFTEMIPFSDAATVILA